MKVSITPCLYTRRLKSSGKYPVKLQVIFNRKKKFYSTGIDLSVQEFNKFHLDRNLQKHYKQVFYYVSKADKIAELLKDDFTFLRFEKQFLIKKSQVNCKESQNVLSSLFAYQRILEDEGRLKSGESFQATINWIKKFRGKKTLTWEIIDPIFLRKFDEFMKEGKLSESSVGIYMRNLRTVFNKAISDKIISQDTYPFGRNKYTPPTTRNIKKALSLTDIEKLYNYVPENIYEARAKDFWFFSYFANGLNIKDICLLKYSNIVDDEIQLIRAKTKNSRKDNQQKISIVLTDELKNIIDRIGKPKTHPDDFVFDRLPENPTPKQIYNVVNQTVKTVNNFIEKIALKLKLSRIPTTNFARHSYSTVLKRAGVPIEMISESLGHSSIRTTQIYLDSFEKEQRKDAVKHLLAFKK